MISVRLVAADSYQSVPVPGLDITFSDFRGREVKHVPVIRIFGSTTMGEKTCLHIHGVFPYIYVPCLVERNMDSFVYRLCTSIDAAINTSLSHMGSNNQHVYKIERVSGIPLYGYHEKEHQFFKIYFYNPALVKRAADLLQNGAVLNQSLQPHEAHIPFVLQFMIDYNLYGMSLIDLKTVKYRHQSICDDSENEEYDIQQHIPSPIPRQSICELELDVYASDILNRCEIEKGLDLNPGIAAIWNDEQARRTGIGLPNAESQLLYTAECIRLSSLSTDNDVYQKERLLRRLHIISQESEPTIKSNSDTTSLDAFSYPLEVVNIGEMQSASRIFQHIESDLTQRTDTKTVGEFAEKLELSSVILSEAVQDQEKLNDTTLLDEGDLHLMDMLVNLAEENDITSLVDDDSVLGSQCAVIGDHAINDNDDEVDDLNITNLDLGSMSSWGSAVQRAQQHNDINIQANQDDTLQDENVNHLQRNSPYITLTNLSQYDGTDSLFVNLQFCKKGASKFPMKPNIKSVTCKKKKKKKELHHLFNTNMLKVLLLNHRQLDIYDINTEFFDDRKEQSVYRKLCQENFKVNSRQVDKKVTAIIPAVDGNTDVTSSDSDSELDITVDSHEARICTYKSRKQSVQHNILSLTPKKQKLTDSTNMMSPKLQKTDSKLLSNTPAKNKLLQSPQCSSRCYTPLNIIVSSPNRRKDCNQIDDLIKIPANSKTSVNSICVTPKHKYQDIRQQTYSKLSSVMQDHADKTCDVVDNEVIKTTREVECTNNDCEIMKNKDDNTLIHNSSTSVRKKLLFPTLSEITDNSSLTINNDKACMLENDIKLPIVEKVTGANMVTDAAFNKSNTNITMQHDNDLMMGPFVENAIDISNVENSQILIEREDICDTTYTEHINTKIFADKYNLSSSQASNRIKEVPFTIVKKHNPPSANRILLTMHLHNLPRNIPNKVIFSNKLDLIKHKETLRSNSNINDIIPFKSSIDGITSIALWRRMKVNEFHPSGASIKSCHIKRALAGYNLLLIRPLINPPSRKVIHDWLRAKTHLAHEKIVKNNLMLKVNQIIPNEETTINAEPLVQNFDRTINCFTKLDSQISNSSSEGLNPSLKKAVENPLVYKCDKALQMGMSHGEIEYSGKNIINNVTNVNLQTAKTVTVHQYLTILSLEIHVRTRHDLLPDPKIDSIEALFYNIQNDVPVSSNLQRMQHGGIIVDQYNSQCNRKILVSSTTCSLTFANSEEDMLNKFVTLITQCDPDILIGWEVEAQSWGYVLQRASYIGFNNYALRLSKIPMSNISEVHLTDKDDFTNIKVPGRIMLDGWRIMRHEVALLSYTFENVMHNVMHERISCPSFQTLTNWWKSIKISNHCRVIEHYIVRVHGTLKLLNNLDIIGRTSEHARLFGIQFYEVFSRGSQFRVESMMLRLAKPLNYIAVSPSVQQRAKMRAPESLPLIMEPESRFYTDPLVVLDFQSLYPSMIIAYNYCFSTCLGRVEHIGQYEPFVFGATTLRIKKHTALKLKDKVNFSPCGVAFVQSEVRQGILPRMLTEILNTRLMVKKSMKLHSLENLALQRALHSQQLGLKLIANVTYGYTAANFSGRMPCMEIADSVVSKGRETLERAIKIVESTEKWGARVVYGDTDSLFVLLPGKSKEEAFEIGSEIANAVTAANPVPVKLKLEKILQPSILQTKKRYCGYMYESPDQEKPEYLAKGIETVRRDGCPAVAKILEKCLKILFETKDLTLIKNYVIRQLEKILHKRVSVQDLTFAREFRGLHGYKANACVPALELTKRLMRKDPRAIPRTSERVPYIIVAGAPNEALIHCIRTPLEVISNSGLHPNSVYYITKVIIPPLNRCLNLVGVDVNTWYHEISRHQILDKASTSDTNNQRITICQFFNIGICSICGAQSNQEICSDCLTNPSNTIVVLHEKLRRLEQSHHQVRAICQSCTGRLDEPVCLSLDCPILYRMFRCQRDIKQIPSLQNMIIKATSNEASTSSNNNLLHNIW